MRRLALTLLTALSLAALAGCGGGATPTPASSTSTTPSTAASAAGGASAPAAAACAPAASGAAATVNATIKDFAFSPQSISAKVGDVISWKNDDSAPHTATLEDDSCGTDTIASGASGALVFNVAGTYTYKCKIHPTQMKGYTIVVT